VCLKPSLHDTTCCQCVDNRLYRVNGVLGLPAQAVKKRDDPQHRSLCPTAAPAKLAWCFGQELVIRNSSDSTSNRRLLILRVTEYSSAGFCLQVIDQRIGFTIQQQFHPRHSARPTVGTQVPDGRRCMRAACVKLVDVVTTSLRRPWRYISLLSFAVRAQNTLPTL